MAIDFTLLGALTVFAFSSSVTPGPNNMMVLASGVNFGFWRTMPHVLGVTFGFGFMVFAIGLGLGALFHRFPMLNVLMKVAGCLYMLWLAWRVANSSRLHEREAGAQPMGFFTAAAFQWVNPKAWMMAISALSNYVLVPDPLYNGAIVALIFMIANTPSILCWAAFGVGLKRYLQNRVMLKAFNITMALLLVLSLWPIIRDLVVGR